MDKPAVLIVGGGLAGALCAVAFKRSCPSVSLMLIEQGDRIGGNHRWSYFDSDITRDGHLLLGGIEKNRWDRHEVRFPKFSRTLSIGYNSFSSAAFDRWARSELPSESLRLGARVEHVREDGVSLLGGESFDAALVIDARGPGPVAGMEVAWQKFTGMELDVPGHGLTHPIIMDARVEQHDGYRFLYTLPISHDRLFIEDTFYSDTADLDPDLLSAAVRAYARDFGVVGAEHGRETGALPIVISGDADTIWPRSAGAARLGMAGGFFHHTTGYSLPFAVANALDFARAWEEGRRPDKHWWRDRFARHWQGQRYFRLLNRMLFGAAQPDRRYRVFEHFYRLPAPVIAHFYSGGLSIGDKCRILMGRPPVPVGRALAALLRKRNGV